MNKPSHANASPNTGVDAVSVTPSDTEYLQTPCRAIYVGTAGDLHIQTLVGRDVTYKNVPAGMFPVGAKQVFATGTTAADILAQY